MHDIGTRPAAMNVFGTVAIQQDVCKWFNRNHNDQPNSLIDISKDVTDETAAVAQPASNSADHTRIKVWN